MAEESGGGAAAASSCPPASRAEPPRAPGPRSAVRPRPPERRAILAGAGPRLGWEPLDTTSGSPRAELGAAPGALLHWGQNRLPLLIRPVVDVGENRKGTLG